MKKIILLSLALFTISVNAQCWKTVSTGADFCVGLKEDGTLWAWGHNESGQLGIGSFEDKNVPTKVGMDADWDSISAGYGFVVALKTNGTIWVWGRNDFGLGSDPGNPTNMPSQVGSDTDWKFVNSGGAGAHSFAIKNDGTLWAWGRNDFGQLGNGSFSHTNVPVQVGSNNDWKMVSAGGLYSIGVKTDNTLWSWGYNYSGQLGQGTAGFGTEVNTPTQITTIPANQWKCIATGGRHSLAITEAGNLWVWGNNNYFALGINDGSSYKSLPTMINNATNWKIVTGGSDHTIAVKQDNTLWAWGQNTDGQLGDGSYTNRAVPVQIDTAADWLLVDGGLQHSIFLREDDVLTSGRNNYGELGIGSSVSHNTPQYVACPAGLGTEENEALPFVVYPNPAKEMLFVQNPQNSKIDTIQIRDISGRIVLENIKASPVNLSQLQAGLYWLQIFSAGQQYQVKFIKD